MKLKLSSLALVAGFAMNVASAAVAQEKVMIGEPSWPGAKIIANILKTVIEDELGGTADIVPGDNAVIFAGMDRGKGDIDVHPDVWLPNHQSFVDEFVTGKGTVALSKSGYEGKSGFCVPKKFAEEHNIHSIYDLATPQASELLDSDGDGKGEVWIGPSGWAATNTREVKLRDYGISNFLVGSNEDEALALANVGAAIREGRGAAFACYSPHYVFKLYDIEILEEPAYDAAKYVMVQPDADPEWFAKSHVETADAPKTIRVGYSKSLEQRAPLVADFFSNIALDADTVSALLQEMVANNRDATEVAKEWVANNHDRVDGWLGLK